MELSNDKMNIVINNLLLLLLLLFNKAKAEY